MKYIIILALSVFTITNIQAQEKTKKVETIEFFANGQCGDCETRINKALDVKGIKLGEFDAETQTVTVVYKTKFLSEDEVHQIITNLGYSTDKKEADAEARAELPGCCVGGKHGTDGPKDCHD